MSGAATSRRIRALIVEEATAQRTELLTALEGAHDITVLPPAGTVQEALDQVAQSGPDVIVLDLHLREGGSQVVIEQVMARTPTPILVLSERIQDRDSPSAVEALVAGALEALPRPGTWTKANADELRRAVRQVSKVPVIRHPRGRLAGSARNQAPASGARSPVVAVAASTGGPSALATFLSGLGEVEAPVLVVQHLHPDFTEGLIEWMARSSVMPVELARDGVPTRPGRVYVGPGGLHLRYAAGGQLELGDEPATSHRPSADELFGSVAARAASAGVGVLLTGMGEDGARGLLEIRRRGGQTFAQDEATSAVFGMPKAAARIGAVTELLPLDKLAASVQRAIRMISSGTPS